MMIDDNNDDDNNNNDDHIFLFQALTFSIFFLVSLYLALDTPAHVAQHAHYAAVSYKHFIHCQRIEHIHLQQFYNMDKTVKHALFTLKYLNRTKVTNITKQ